MLTTRKFFGDLHDKLCEYENEIMYENILVIT